MGIPKFLFEDMETFTFVLPNPMQPLDIMADIGKYVRSTDSVVHFQSYFGNRYVCTICGNNAVAELKCSNKINICNNLYPYEIAESTVKRVMISKVPGFLKQSDMDNFFRQFGKVLYGEVEERPNGNVYLCLIEGSKSIPEKMTLKRYICDVVTF